MINKKIQSKAQVASELVQDLHKEIDIYVSYQVRMDDTTDIISAYLDSQRGDGLTFHNDKPSARALYSPTFDSVTVPMLSQYKAMEEYYSTTFHELVHSTAKASRLNRQAEQKAHAFGSQDYSREELVAEMGSAMLCQCAGLDCQQAFKNSVAYINGWLSK